MSTQTVQESNPLPEGYHESVTDKIQKDVYWDHPGLKIIRLRFLSDPGFAFWDVSYCHGQLSNGDYVNVHLPFHQLNKWTDGSHTHPARINRQIVEFARRDRVFARSLGIFDVISTFN